MAILGRVYPITYFAKNGKTGLTDVMAKVKKPDGSIDGPFALTEDLAEFAGSYYVNYFTSAAGLEGEYIFLVWEPGSGHKAFKQVEFNQLSSGDSGSADIKRNGFTEIEISRGEGVTIETSSNNIDFEIDSNSNATIFVSDIDDTDIDTDGNNTNIGV